MKIFAVLLFMLADNGHVKSLFAPIKFDTVEQCKAFLSNGPQVEAGINAGRAKYGRISGVQAMCLPENRIDELKQFLQEHNRTREGA